MARRRVTRARASPAGENRSGPGPGAVRQRERERRGSHRPVRRAETWMLGYRDNSGCWLFKFVYFSKTMNMQLMKAKRQNISLCNWKYEEIKR